MQAMAAAQDGRLEELYSQYFREVLAYCARRGSLDDAYDAANEVFTIAWRRITDIPSGKAARPWLFVVAKRVLYRRRRGAHRFRRLVEKAGTIRSHGSPDPETVVVQRAEYALVLQAASQLSIRDREVLKLAAWEGLPHREIAEILGCSIAAVDQRLHRAKQRLAKQYHAASPHVGLREAAGGDGS